MIETCIAIIVACLPALRSVILGNTTHDASSYGKHYELGSARRRTNENRLTASGNTSGMLNNSRSHTHISRSRDPNGSEDSLVASGLSVGLDGQAKIRVDTTIETNYGEEDAKSRAGSARSAV